MTSPLPYRNRSFSIASALDSIKDMTPFAVFVTRRKSETVINSSFSPRTVVNRCFLKLLIACILVYVFKHPTILTLLPLPVSFIVIKRSGVFVWTRYKPLSFIDEEKQALIVPKPIRALWSVVSKGDQKILAMIEDTISKVTTIVLLCFILLFAITFFIVIVAQVQRESVQLVWTTANLVNETVSRNPEIAKWLPQSDTMQSTLSSVIDKGYEHGREWMAKKVSGIITESEDPKGVERLKIEKELLAVIDELYKSWHTNHTAPVSGIIELCKLGLTACPAAATTNPSDPLTNLDSTTGRKDSATQTTQESWTSPAQIRLAIDSMMKSAWVTAQLKDILDVNRVMEIVRNNIGSVISVMESLWLIFRSNVHSVVNFATAMISLLFGGGTALLNFVVSTVVFLTTLFYLLSTSENDYKPIGWMTSFAGPVFPTSEFEAAISSVLLATLKMAVFYGLYTWLTHTIFGINIVFIPSALAAIFAAVPFLGTYWAAVPAMVELWIVKGDRLRAILLFLSHLLPTYVIDIMIYADIKDGGHPYLTGLAIVGGIYYLGLQGAIIGPILLCCLIVVFNIYKAMLSVEAGVSESSDPASDQPPRPNSQFRNSVPDIYLHRSTPPSVSTPHGGAGANPLVSPSTPNSVFSPNHALLRKAVFGSARMQRSNSLPNVDEVESNATDQ